MATIRDQQKIVNDLHAAFVAKVPKPQQSIRVRQQQMAIRPPPRGGVWISQDTFHGRKNTGNLRDILVRIVDATTPAGVSLPSIDSLACRDVPAEWIGQRKGASSEHTEADLTDQEIYQKLCTDVDNDLTILYTHGGAFYVGSPASSRPATTKLAKLTKARVVSIAYRLAPQHPFPAALLDLLTAYLSLLYPAPDARYPAVLPGSVVLAGDSAGGNLALALVQVVLMLQATPHGSQIEFNGRKVQVPLPAGLAVLSPFVDLSYSLPSWSSNAHIDYLTSMAPAMTPQQIPDDVWPSKPPRGDPYCHPSAWLHPLVSPVLFTNWSGAPPMWIATGEERGADGAKAVSAHAARCAVAVNFSEYLGMPHIFPIMLGKLPQSQRCFKDWADACLSFWQKAERTQRSNGTVIQMPGDKQQTVDVRNLSILSIEEISRLAKASAQQRKPWTGPTTNKL